MDQAKPQQSKAIPKTVRKAPNYLAKPQQSMQDSETLDKTKNGEHTYQRFSTTDSYHYLTHGTGKHSAYNNKYVIYKMSYSDMQNIR